VTASFEFTGRQRFDRRLEEMVARTDFGTERALIEAGAAAEREMKDRARTGSHAPGTPTSARPGDGPNSITGNLLRNIKVTLPRRIASKTREIMVGVGRGAPYAILLERGFRGVRYPFVEPAIKRIRELFPALLHREWSRH